MEVPGFAGTHEFKVAPFPDHDAILGLPFLTKARAKLHVENPSLCFGPTLDRVGRGISPH